MGLFFWGGRNSFNPGPAGRDAHADTDVDTNADADADGENGEANRNVCLNTPALRLLQLLSSQKH